MQSALPTQPSPAGQPVGHPPPQSTPVSVPFWIPSVQLGAWQTKPTHTPLSQSVASLQPPSVAQGTHAGPPQSTSVSEPSLTPSVQVRASQRLLKQVPFPHCDARRHPTHCPAWLHTAPPSMSHGMPSGPGAFPGAPSKQVSTVQGLPSSRTLVSSSTTFTFPAPSQISLWQSPGTWWWVGVPSAASFGAQKPPTQARVLHTVSSPGQSKA